MSEEMNETDELLIKTLKYFLSKSVSKDVESQVDDIRTESEILNRTGVHIISGQRHSEHGPTLVQTLAFPQKEQRLKVLELFNNPALYKRIPDLLQYIYDLGKDADGETRYFASLAITELAVCFPFIDLKEAVIKKWARHEYSTVNKAAALTLVGILQKDLYKKDILFLLKHWIDNQNLRLVDTALTTYFEVAKIYPQETLDSIKIILLKRHAMFLVPKALALLEWLYLNEPLLTTDTLYEWFSSTQNDNLVVFSALTFLSIVDVRDFTKNDKTCIHVVDFIYQLWENIRIPQRQHMQQATTDALLGWAETTLHLDKNNPIQPQCLHFFHRLHRKCETTRQNRLDFHLRRWQRNEEAKWKRLHRLQPEKFTVINQLDFLSLIPASA
jgi:hypothetical protein